MKRTPQVTGERQFSGFTLIEVMIAAGILVIGLVGLLGMFGHALATVALVKNDLIARQKVREAMEGIYTARNTAQVEFDDIENVSDGGIFLDGPQSLQLAGDDGLLGTADDGDPEVMLLPGPDGLLGTEDDVSVSLARFQRTIAIDPVLEDDDTVNPDIRIVTVTVEYPSAVGGAERSFQVTSYVSRFR